MAIGIYRMFQTFVAWLIGLRVFLMLAGGAVFVELDNQIMTFHECGP